MIRHTLQAALCIALSPLLVAQHTRPLSKPVLVSLPKGTQLNLVLLETISSFTARKGQAIRLAVATDLMAGGCVVIPVGYVVMVRTRSLV